MSSNRVLWLGIVASVLLTAVIWLIRPWLPQIDFLPDTGARWYYWQLPEPTQMSRITAWCGYFLHQIVIWWTIYYAQSRRHKFSSRLHWINIVAITANVFFILLHILQTKVWYDGLARDVSIFSSQGSVIILLVMILLMENQRRGLFFGKKVGFLQETGRVARKYHGYIFAWAIIYTFWYHPIETTSGHLLGLLYTFLLLLQGSLLYTRSHVNKYWTLMLEVFVLIHGSLVAYLVQGSDIWAMFFFGFAGLFVITQMHGLGLRLWQRWLFFAVYIIGIVLVYNGQWQRINEIIRIPVIEYLAVFLLAGIIWLLMKLFGTKKSI